MGKQGRGSAGGIVSMPQQVLALAFYISVLCCELLASAATLAVGGSQGWDVGVDYTTWAASQTFAVGDVLFFSYASGAHNVAEVNKSGYDACSAAGAIALHTEGNTSITLTSAGTFYFMCSFPTHCTSGMKLAVAVGASSTSPSPSPTTSVGTPPSTSPKPSPPVLPPSATVPTPVPSVKTPSAPVPSATTPASTPAPAPAPALAPGSTHAPAPSPVKAPVSGPASGTTPPSAPAPPTTPPSAPPSSAPRLSSPAAALLFAFLSAALLATF